MKKQLVVIMVIVWASCKPSPEPIDYGSDACHYCSMTIVDQQHAAQFVTKKGRAYKFDAIECMMNHLREVDSTEVALYRVNGYKDPGKLIDAKQATYLISRQLPSPMGEFLSAFGNEENAKFAKRENGGELLSWEELQEHFMNKQI